MTSKIYSRVVWVSSLNGSFYFEKTAPNFIQDFVNVNDETFFNFSFELKKNYSLNK